MNTISQFLPLLFLSASFCVAQTHTIDVTQTNNKALELALPTPHIAQSVHLASDIELDTQDIQRLIGIHEGQLVSAHQLKRAAFYLRHTNRFAQILCSLVDSLLGQGIHITFNTQAHWLLKQIFCRGIWFGREKLQHAYLISPGTVFDEKRHNQSIETYKSNYHEQGYLAARIVPKIIRHARDKTITVIIDITRGPRFRIGTAHVACSHKSTFTEFPPALTAKLTSAVQRLLEGKIYSNIRIQTATAQLSNILAQDNFLLVKIKHSLATTASTTVDITFQIKIAKHGTIEFVGNHHFSKMGLIESINSQAQEAPWSLTPAAIAQHIAHLYHAHEYPQATVDTIRTTSGWQLRIHEDEHLPVASHKNITTKTKDKITHSITQHATTANHAEQIIGTTIVSGLPGLKNKHIIDLCLYRENTALNSKLIDATFNRLRRLGIFDAIELYPLPELDPDGRQPIVVHVVQDQQFELQARTGLVGANKARGNTYVLGATGVYKNPTHGADQLLIDADFTRFGNTITGQYNRPITFAHPLWLSLNAYTKRYRQPLYVGSRSWLYYAQEQGCAAGFSYEPETFKISLNSTFESIKIKNLTECFAQALHFCHSLVGYREPYFRLEPFFSFEHVDNHLDPHRGISALGQAKIMIPLGAHGCHFARLWGQMAFFIPFPRRCMLATNMAVGHIVTSSFAQLLPSERFYLGGPHSVRSYQVDMAPPYGCCHDEGIDKWVPQGGQTAFNLNLEARIPLTKTVGMVLFQDAGLLSNPYCHQAWSWATGFGLRYATPIGPIRFDLGFKPHRSTSDCSLLAWFLTFGHAF